MWILQQVLSFCIQHAAEREGRKPEDVENQSNDGDADHEVMFLLQHSHTTSTHLQRASDGNAGQGKRTGES